MSHQSYRYVGFASLGVCYNSQRLALHVAPFVSECKSLVTTSFDHRCMLQVITVASVSSTSHPPSRHIIIWSLLHRSHHIPMYHLQVPSVIHKQSRRDTGISLTIDSRAIALNCPIHHPLLSVHFATKFLSLEPSTLVPVITVSHRIQQFP